MRQLKITKSTTNRRPMYPSMKELLDKEPFDVEVFTKAVAAAEQEIKDKQDDLIREFQRLESNCVLAMSHLPEGQTYADLIADLRECGEEINKLRLLNARSILSIANGYCDSGVPLRELLLAAMQGVKNSALVYNCAPGGSFIDFAIPHIRKHIEEYIRSGKMPYSQPDNEYEKMHEELFDCYNKSCRGDNRIERFLRHNSKEQINNLFENAKIGRCRKEVITAADHAEWKMVDIALHLPDDYDERDKFIRTSTFMVQDALYCGECKDIVKPVGGEWSICTSPAGERIAISALTDRKSLRTVHEQLIEILSNLSKTGFRSFHEWRIAKGR
jgi:DNA-directed RNA polymerase sigma subunit (sigma70/sigma32)